MKELTAEEPRIEINNSIIHFRKDGELVVRSHTLKAPYWTGYVGRFELEKLDAALANGESRVTFYGKEYDLAPPPPPEYPEEQIEVLPCRVSQRRGR